MGGVEGCMSGRSKVPEESDWGKGGEGGARFSPCF